MSPDSVAASLSQGEEPPFGADHSRAPEARRQLDREGITIAEWAKRHGYSVRLVYAVLEGQRRCLRGQSHDIAVRLGLKDGVLSTRPDA